MIFPRVLFTVLAPALTHASAFPGKTPHPTLFAPAAVNWSPAPTAIPLFGRLDLFGRAEAKGNNTCGYVSASSQSPLTCPQSTFICATNTYDGVHGCCDPSAISSCTLPTTCIPSSAIPSACSSKSCTSNSAILQCSAATLPECQQYVLVFSKTRMTQYNCGVSPLTATAYTTWGAIPSSTTAAQDDSFKTVTATVTVGTSSSSSSLSSAASPASQQSSSPDLGVIIGATVGGCVVLSGIALVLFFVYRKRKAVVFTARYPDTAYAPRDEGVVEASYVACEQKTWKQADGRGVQGETARWDGQVERGEVVVAEIDGRPRAEMMG